MNVPKKIQYAADRLKAGKKVNKIIVRDFLSHFGAQRRGALKVEEIKSILDQLGLETQPDFRSAWIGAPLSIKVKNHTESPSYNEELASDDETNDDEAEIVLEGSAAAVMEAEQQSRDAPTSAEPSQAIVEGEITDPSFRIGIIPAANKVPVGVNQDDPIIRAVTIMLQYDYSQLPVMQGEREVKGMVTWRSICKQLTLDPKSQGPSNLGEKVSMFREKEKIVEYDAPFFEAIPVIAEFGYVLVRHSDKKIKGPVTLNDLSLVLRDLTEPFLRIREIKLHVRALIESRLDPTDFSIALRNNASAAGKPAAELTIGDYVSIFQHPDTWAKLKIGVD